MPQPTPASSTPQPNGVTLTEGRRRRSSPVAPENEITATTRTRTPRNEPERNAPEAERHPRPSAPARDAPTRPARSGPVRFERIPLAVQQRYYNIDNRWFLENGEAAFTNYGDRLTTKSENRQIVRDLIEIARENRAEAITVSGTENFQRVAWREATRLGLRVEGYVPTAHDQKQLVRQMSRERAAQGDRREVGETAEQAMRDDAARPRVSNRTEGEASPNRRKSGRSGVTSSAAASPTKERFFYGEFVDHGPENYKWDPKEDMSYYVKLATDSGEKVLWGKDLERALQDSTTRLRIGDQIGIRQTGRRTVTVQERERDNAGNVVGEKDKLAHRNDWLIEKREFFDERASIAETVRDAAVPAREAVKRHPQLVGTAAVLKAAEEYAKTLPDARTREAFIGAVRNTLADEIARGEPLRTARVRTPDARAAAAASSPKTREPVGERVVV